ncbi:glycosyltransferase [Priestia megaterium]|uniref:Glycosyltransferase n=1 Tax=Priestia megaterium TaxID=1404 RepID=A0A6H1NWH4_PRIMG|nr:glycosyltransferase [Priestia megaterium]QIZ05618.1 glycosyltransferase [Priestia megaterium]
MNKQEILTRLEEIQQLKKKVKIMITPTIAPKTNGMLLSRQKFKNGISVIIPTYKGEKVIMKVLDSLYNQTLKKELFDVIIIINGEKDSTESLVNDFINKNQIQNITLLYSSKASASSSRNVGIQHAEREYTVFLDDDDYVSSNFLEEMLNLAQPDTSVVTQIVNIDEQGNADHSNAINKQIINAEKNPENTLATLNMVATINACKLVPTRCLKEIQYDVNLRSGEDVVFFTELFVKNDLKFNVIPINKQAIYFRVLRNNSVSRQEMTFDFFVSQRLAVIKCLDQLISQTTDVNKKTFIKQKINAQTTFINRYLKENLTDREKAVNEIKMQNLSYMPYSIVNRGLADKLIIAYCFPPYVDTSGNVMAKRIRDMKEVVDVVYNKMDKVREKDLKLNYLIDDLIEERIEIPTYPSFSNWKAIDDFCNHGMEKIDKSKKYKEVYSRAMWPGSHFLAYQYKMLNPKVKWVAEFSDPILLDIHGKKRESKIEDANFIKKANKLIGKKHKLQPVNDTNLFFWCEYLPYLFADELIFTNEHQLKYMLESFPIKGARKIIKRKAKISPQPTLPKEFYYLKESNYSLDQDKANIAYFGTFYQTRNLDDLFAGLEKVNDELRKHINLHIFTANPAPLLEELKGSKLEENVKVNPYASYYEFLNLTTSFDCLVVNDAKTKDSKPINPYLPSKLSDYIGSDTNIWGIYEENSILSHHELPYKSELGNIEQAALVFEQIVTNKKNLKAEV